MGEEISFNQNYFDWRIGNMTDAVFEIGGVEKAEVGHSCTSSALDALIAQAGELSGAVSQYTTLLTSDIGAAKAAAATLQEADSAVAASYSS